MHFSTHLSVTLTLVAFDPTTASPAFNHTAYILRAQMPNHIKTCQLKEITDAKAINASQQKSKAEATSKTLLGCCQLVHCCWHCYHRCFSPHYWHCNTKGQAGCAQQPLQGRAVSNCGQPAGCTPAVASNNSAACCTGL